MRCPRYTLTPAAVHHHATALVQAHLKLPDHGPKCQAAVLLTLLFTAASWLTPLSDGCRRLRYAPSDEAVLAGSGGYPARVCSLFP